MIHRKLGTRDRRIDLGGDLNGIDWPAGRFLVGHLSRSARIGVISHERGGWSRIVRSTTGGISVG